MRKINLFAAATAAGVFATESSEKTDRMNKTTNDEKNTFRRMALKMRGKIQNREEKSAQIARSLFNTQLYQNADAVFVYMAYRSEADTEPVITRSLADGKCVAVPRVTGTDMVFCRITSMDCCKKGAYGILEPGSDCPEVQPDKKGLILVPGCAFTRDGMRMGYGGGYYDRYLQAHPDVVTVGYAFEEQIFETIPCEAHDRKLDFIVTQKGHYKS